MSEKRKRQLKQRQHPIIREVSKQIKSEEEKMEEENNIQKLAQQKSSELCDSLTISSPTKGGAIKLYGDFNKPDEFKVKVDKAIEVRAYANAKIAINI